MVGILDFSKAFDTVPHDALLYKLDDALLYKLDAYGIRGKQYAWIKAFLTERHMTVIVEGEFSSEAIVDSGVPQSHKVQFLDHYSF